MNSRLRAAGQGDLSLCISIFIEAFRQTPWKEEWDEEKTRERLAQVFHTPFFWGAIAENEGGITGFAIGFREAWKKGWVYYLKETCVNPDVQRMGIGSQLMQFMMTELSKQDVEKIYLLTGRSDLAESFYKKLGFYTSEKMIMMGKYLRKQ